MYLGICCALLSPFFFNTYGISLKSLLHTRRVLLPCVPIPACPCSLCDKRNEKTLLGFLLVLGPQNKPHTFGRSRYTHVMCASFLKWSLHSFGFGFDSVIRLYSFHSFLLSFVSSLFASFVPEVVRERKIKRTDECGWNALVTGYVTN